MGEARRCCRGKGWLLASLGLCAGLVLVLAGAPPIAAERERGSEPEGLDRSLDDPAVRPILERWARANRARDFSHPPFNELDGVERSLDEQRRDRGERAERRKAPEERAERRRRRREFKDLGREGAIELARREFPQLFSGQDQRALPLESGERVVRYGDEHTAVIESAAGGRSLVDSSVPLRAPEGGQLEPVDYDLARTAAGWEPQNSPVEMEFGERASDAFAFPGAFGVSVPGVDAAASRTANEVFFPDVAKDTDIWFTPAASGVRFAFQLRSEDAPEELRLQLSSAAGIELRVAAGARGFEVIRDGKVAGRMRAPVALDADGEEIDVTLRVEGSEVVFEIAHRGLDLAYPAVLDPVLENQDSWKYGNGNYAGWSYYEQVPQFPHGYSAGLYIYRNPSYYWWYGLFAEWQYRSPTASSFIYRTDFMHMAHTADQTNVTQGIWSTRWNRHQHQYTQGYTYDAANSFWSACADGGTQAWQCDEAVNLDQSMGNYAQSSLWANANGPRASWAAMYMGGARVYMNDVNTPELFYFHDAGPGWMHDTPAGPYNARNEAHVRWGDRGLGMWQLWMDVPGRARQYSSDAGGCSGAHSSRCPESRAHNFTYAGILEGTRTVTTGANDVLNRVASSSRTLRIDRSRPAAPTLSGTLAGAAGGEIGAHKHTLGIQGSDAYSGVKSVSYRVVPDGSTTPVRSGGASNPSCGTYGCSNPWKPADFQVDLAGLTPGRRYRVETSVKDQLGDDPTYGSSSHTTTSSFYVTIEDDPPTLEVGGTLKPSGSEWVGRGDQSVLLDSTDAQSGVTHAELQVDGQAVETVDRPCDAGGCALSHDFVVDSDSYAEGEHTARALVRDGAGNLAQEDWTFRLERTAPTLTLSGTLKAAEGQTLTDGATYTLVAGSTDTVGMSQAGVKSIAVAIDDDPADIVTQECPFGGCAMTRAFEYRPDDYESGPRTITVTATDFAGNQTSESFVVTNPDLSVLRCPDAPSPTAVVNVVPTTPEAALTQIQSPSGFPEAVGPAQATDLDGGVIQPGLDASDPDRFRASGTVAQSEIDREASDGATATLETLRGPVCLTPTEVSVGASQPSGPVNGVAAMYANSRPATDTVLRPSPAGVQMFNQLRGGLAPKRLAWHVALQPGQELRQLVDGEVAVVIPALEGAAPPVSGAVLPPKPTVAQRQAALSDTALALDVARDQFRRAQARTADEIVALLPEPWARDAQGRTVPATLTASGSTVELRVEHDLLANEFPVVAALHVLGGDSVDEIEAAKSSEETAEYTEEEADSFEPAGVPPSTTTQRSTAAPAAAVAAASPDDPDYDADPVSLSADDSDDLQGFTPQEGDEEPPPDASTAIADAELAQNVGNFGFGLTESDPANLDDPKRSELGLQFYRPFVAWNIVALKGSTKPADVRRVRRWEDYYNRAKALGLKLDVVLTRTADRTKGGTAPSVGEYKKAVQLFLDTYPGVVKNLMPWNEPNFKKDPLYRRPSTAAQYWLAAQNICHPKGTPTNPNPPARCGHVVAGDYVGLLAKHDPKVSIKGKRTRFTTAYKNHLDKRGQHPKVWAFHNYGDWKAWGLRAKNREQAPITDRHYRLFRQRGEGGREDYRFSQGSERRLPKIWLTEAGVGYHYSCRDGLTDGFQSRYCGGVIGKEERDRMLLMGMASQRSALGFLLSKLAKDFPAIKRIYYLRLRAGTGRVYPAENGLPATRDGECEIERPPADAPRPWCPKNDYGLVGADDDGTYEFDHFLPRSAGRSAPNQRRLAFCLFRDRNTRQGRNNIRNPERLKSCGAPASQ